MRGLLSVVCVCASIAVGAGAKSVAQERRERPRPVLIALDLDHDGSLSAAELRAAPTSLRTLDVNGDGELTFDEFEPARQESGASPDQLVTQMMLFDKNGDGALTPDELPARMQAMFTRGDTNHDGKLTADEIRAMAQHNGRATGARVVPGKAGMNMRLDPLLNALDANHDGVISAEEIAAATTELMALDVNGDGIVEQQEMRVRQQTPAERADHLMEEWDTNHDGKLTADEVPDGLKARFAQADANHDGFLDRAEVEAMFASMPAGGSGNPAPAPSATAPKGQHD